MSEIKPGVMVMVKGSDENAGKIGTVLRPAVRGEHWNLPNGMTVKIDGVDGWWVDFPNGIKPFRGRTDTVNVAPCRSAILVPLNGDLSQDDMTTDLKAPSSVH